ncbi:unnamed protein product, partial [Didymodactylos carnosus]
TSEFNPTLTNQDEISKNLICDSHKDKRSKSLGTSSVFTNKDSQEQTVIPNVHFQIENSNEESIPLTTYVSNEHQLDDMQIIDPYKIHHDGTNAQIYDSYNNNVEYQIQDLSKRLDLLETKLSQDMSTVLTILQRQFPSEAPSVSDTINDNESFETVIYNPKTNL